MGRVGLTWALVALVGCSRGSTVHLTPPETLRDRSLILGLAHDAQLEIQAYERSPSGVAIGVDVDANELSLTLLSYPLSLRAMSLAPGRLLVAADGRALRPPEAAWTRVVSAQQEGTWSTADFEATALSGLLLDSPSALHCPTGEHDGGARVCLPLWACAAGLSSDADGACVTYGSCSSGVFDSRSGRCVLEAPCSDGYAEGGDGSCVPAGTCSVGFSIHPTGCLLFNCPLPDWSSINLAGGFERCRCDSGTSAVPEALGRCDPGVHCGPGDVNAGDGYCLPPGRCVAGYHDDGAGTCVPLDSCATNFVPDAGGVCVQRCPSGEHDGGDQVCRPMGTCSGSFLLSEDGSCHLSCALGQHDDGEGRCAPLGQCAPGRHPGGFDACVEEGGCAPLYRLESDGRCGPLGSWRTIASLGAVYVQAARTLDGRVVMLGTAALRYDPITRSVSPSNASGLMLNPCRDVIALQDGRALAFGPAGRQSYDPVGDRWSIVTSTANHYYGVAQAGDGRIVALTSTNTSVHVEIATPALNDWLSSPPPRLLSAKMAGNELMGREPLKRMDDGRLAVFTSKVLTSFSLFETQSSSWTETVDGPPGGNALCMIPLDDGSLLFAGGRSITLDLFTLQPNSGAIRRVGRIDAHAASCALTRLPSGDALLLWRGVDADMAEPAWRMVVYDHVRKRSYRADDPTFPAASDNCLAPDLIVLDAPELLLVRPYGELLLYSPP